MSVTPPLEITPDMSNSEICAIDCVRGVVMFDDAGAFCAIDRQATMRFSGLTISRVL